MGEPETLNPKVKLPNPVWYLPLHTLCVKTDLETLNRSHLSEVPWQVFEIGTSLPHKLHIG